MGFPIESAEWLQDSFDSWCDPEHWVVENQLTPRRLSRSKSFFCRYCIDRPSSVWETTAAVIVVYLQRDRLPCPSRGCSRSSVREEQRGLDQQRSEKEAGLCLVEVVADAIIGRGSEPVKRVTERVGILVVLLY